MCSLMSEKVAFSSWEISDATEERELIWLSLQKDLGVGLNWEPRLRT